MKNNLRVLTFAMLFHAASSWASPMLSTDGTTLTGLDVGGTLYDVTFGDGVLASVYGGVTFDAARESEANAISDALVVALNLLGASYSDIAGCEATPRNGREICMLFNPDTINPSDGDYSDNGVTYTDRNVFGGAWVSIATTGSSPSPSFDSTGSEQLTLVQYQLAAPVPIPTTLALFGLGLAGLGWLRRTKV